MAARPHSPPPVVRVASEPVRVPRGETYVRPGELVVVSRPTVLFTVLGSCVSVCLWDARSGTAGMNHFVFPGRPDDPTQRGPRFGVDAVEGLLERMADAGADLTRTVAKLFGGARIPGAHRNVPSISDENAAVAAAQLGRRGIAIVSQDLGGHSGRKVLFDTATGDVWVKCLVESGDD